MIILPTARQNSSRRCRNQSQESTSLNGQGKWDSERRTWLRFRYALANGFDYIFEMDADFSHDPLVLPRLLENAEKYNLVIGSRYIKGVNVVNWPMRRLLLSYFGESVHPGDHRYAGT